MNLTPQEKEIGKENFFSVIGNPLSGSKLSRREMLKRSGAAVAVSGSAVGGFYFGYEKSINKPLRVGVIGTGDEGNVLLGAVTPSFIEVGAICDIRPFNVFRAFHGDVSSPAALKARPGLMTKYGWKTEDEARKHVKVYTDYKELLADKSLEAIIIGLPLHLHAPVAIEAMKAGKHVLTEKLMAPTVGLCKQMARVSDETGKLLAVGHQRHYNVLYDNAVETIKKGLLGDLHYIRAQWHRGNMPGTDSWAQPLPPGTRADEKKGATLLDKLKKLKDARAKGDAGAIEKLDKEVAQLEAQIADKNVDAAKYGYETKKVCDLSGAVKYEASPLEELIRWRLWKRTGGGLMVELGSHQLDAASIFVGAANPERPHPHPLNVSAACNRMLFNWDREIEDHIYCIIEFPGPGYDPKDKLASQRKIGVTYASINGNGFGGYGEMVFGTKGTLIIEREKEAMLFKDSDTSSKVGVAKGKGGSGPTLDTQASGGGHAAVAAAAVGPDVSRGYTEEIEHWAWCVRNPDPKNQPKCNAKVAMGDAVIALTTNIAAREGRRVEFKESWFDVKSDDTPETDLAKASG